MPDNLSLARSSVAPGAGLLIRYVVGSSRRTMIRRIAIFDCAERRRIVQMSDMSGVRSLPGMAAAEAITSTGERIHPRGDHAGRHMTLPRHGCRH